MDRAFAGPAAREHDHRAGFDLDDFAIVGAVYRPTRNEMAEFVARDGKPPATRRAYPDAVFRAVVRSLVHEPPRGMRRPFQRVGLRPPVDKVGAGGGVVE